jgi:hypothetical protein
MPTGTCLEIKVSIIPARGQVLVEDTSQILSIEDVERVEIKSCESRQGCDGKAN